MKEEEITLEVIKYLKKKKWQIAYYDFPECGSPKRIKCNILFKKKILQAVVPDLVAHKKNVGIIAENKKRFSVSDVTKLSLLKQSRGFRENIINEFNLPKTLKIYFGIFVPRTESLKVVKYKSQIDFFGLVGLQKNIKIISFPRSFVRKKRE